MNAPFKLGRGHRDLAGRILQPLIDDVERLLDLEDGRPKNVDTLRELMARLTLLSGGARQFGAGTFTPQKVDEWESKCASLLSKVIPAGARTLYNEWYYPLRSGFQSLSETSGSEDWQPRPNDWPKSLLPGRMRVFPYASHRAFTLVGDFSPEASPEMEMEQLQAGQRLFFSWAQMRIFTDSYAHVPVDVEMRATAPAEVDDYPWDEIVELGLEAHGAFIVGGGIDGEHLSIPASGDHIVRLHIQRAPDEDDQNHNGDFYLIQIWPGERIEKTVIR